MNYGRTNTIDETLDLLNEESAMIFEIGTIRQAEGKLGDGHATIAWGEYVSKNGGEIITVDSDPHAIAICRYLTQKYKNHIRYLVGDAFNVFADFQSNQRRSIDLLYLDAWEQQYISPDGKIFDGYQKYIEFFDAIRIDIRFILIDDTHRPGWMFSGPERVDYRFNSTEIMGKGRLLVPHLINKGWNEIFFKEGQVLFSAPKGNIDVKTQTTQANAET